jgi:hypothetical protein
VFFDMWVRGGVEGSSIGGSTRRGDILRCIIYS